MTPRALFTHRSLRNRLLWLVIVASALAAGAVALSVVTYEQNTHKPRALDSLKKSSRLLQEVLPAALDFGGTENAVGYLRTYVQEVRPGIEVAAVYDGQGILFANWPQVAGGRIPAAAKPVEARFTNGCLQVWRPIERSGAIVGYLYLEEKLPPLHLRLPQYGIIVSLVALTVAAVAFALFIGTRFYVIGPLGNLLRTATKVTLEDDYRARATVEREDEIGELARAFNRMLETVGSRDAALRLARARIEQVFRATSEVAIVVTEPNGLVTMFNVGAERMLGYTAAEIVGSATPLRWHKMDTMIARHPELFSKPMSDSESFKLMVANITPDQPFSEECILIAKGGREVKVQLAVTTVCDSTGKITGYLGVATDLTQREQAERDRERLQIQLIQAQKLDAIGQLAGGIAHDFNNVLGAMMMQTDLMRTDHPADPRLLDELGELQGYINRAANLTRQLLMFSRRQVAQIGVIDLNLLLGNLIRMLRRVIGENIHLDFQPSPGTAWINADPNMLEQVVVNLAVNARDAMPRGGKLQIRITSEELSSDSSTRHPSARAGRFIKLTMTDEGCGMDAKTLQRLFEPFFTTKEPGKGTGLGLATAYGIVAKHGGWMEVRSTVGTGTTFDILLPESSGPTETLPSPDEPPEEVSGTETILYVEDDTDVRSLGVSILQRLGYQVLVAHSGPEALMVWRTHGDHIDILLTDMIMPGGMTGLELSQELRKFRPTLPVLLTSGYSLELTQLGWEAGAEIAFLPKPYKPHALGQHVRSVLDNALKRESR